MKQTIFIFSLPKHGSSDFAKCFGKRFINFAEYLTPELNPKVTHIPKYGNISQVFLKPTNEEYINSTEFWRKWNPIKKYRDKGIFEVSLNQYNNFYRHQPLFTRATDNASKNIFLFRSNGLDAWTSFCLECNKVKLSKQKQLIKINPDHIHRYIHDGPIKHANNFLDKPLRNLSHIIILESIKNCKKEYTKHFPEFQPTNIDLEKDFCYHTRKVKEHYIKNYDELVKYYIENIKDDYDAIKKRVKQLMKQCDSLGDF